MDGYCSMRSSVTTEQRSSEVGGHRMRGASLVPTSCSHQCFTLGLWIGGFLSEPAVYGLTWQLANGSNVLHAVVLPSVTINPTVWCLHSSAVPWVHEGAMRSEEDAS